MEGQRVHGRRRGAPRGARHRRGGLHKGPNLLDYRIPTSLDMPDIVALHRRVATTPRARTAPRRRARARCTRRFPAIANAIYNAVGVRIDRLPFTPARVLAALRDKRARARAGEKAAE